MKLAIMQPYFMPYIGYFQCINSVDEYLLYDKVSYIKKGWINRNRIKVINVGPVYITIPLNKISCNVCIKDITINDTILWRKQILDLVYFNYKKSPFFDETYDLLNRCINFNDDSISKYNYNSILNICKHLDIKTKISISSNKLFDELENDIKKFEMSSTERMFYRVLSICKEFDAHTYINAIGGQELYDKEEFKRNGIDLYFVKTNDIKYFQFKDDAFEPNLSIIDVLMFNGKEGTKKLLNEYTLV